MAESLVLPVVRDVIGKAADALVQSITRMWGVDGDRDNLERQLLAVQFLLTDAEVKSETTPAVKAWMKKLKAVAYRADDVLDHFQYEALRREAQGRRSMSRKVLSHFTRDSPLLFRLKVSRELKDVLDKINDLVEEMNKFGLVVRAEAPQAIYRQTHSALDQSEETYGRDDDKAAVVKLLFDQQDQQNVQVLPIIGIGGLGKTTLAKMVYNDSRVQKHFELKMWHCVSEDFEVTAVLRSIIELATKEICTLRDSIELLRVKLQEVIGRRRFLLILDDVWNEDQRKWDDDLRPLLCSSIGGSGSMIVVTSRSQKVASIMGTLPPYRPECLSEDDSWELFSKKAFSKEGMKEQKELVAIGRRIVNKCKGLPLALKTMGGLMSSKERVHEWEAIADCSISDTSRGKDEVMSILKLSYRHLSSEMKQCFAFCAVFPKDYEMEKDMLIQLWMANGYILEEGTESVAQKAELIFSELVWRSFLEDVTLVRTYRSHPSRQELKRCKMHDLMHDLAKGVGNECATVEELIQRKKLISDVYHLRISSDHELNEITQLFRGTIYLRTLLNDTKLVNEKLMSPRALCFKSPDYSIVQRQLTRTSHLRYLDLSGSEMVSLPESVCMLYNLLSLRLNDCTRLQYLPEGMSSMRKLSHIYLLGCDSLQRMPPKLSLLHNLCILTTFVVNSEDGHGIEELEELRQLGNRLELYNLRKVKCGSKANLDKKQDLNELLLNWGLTNSTLEEPTDDEATNQEQVLEFLVPHDKLKFLEVDEYGGRTISNWMRRPQMFQCLRKLTMDGCLRCKDLPIVWLSPTLEYLSLRRMNSLTTLCKNVDVEAKAHDTSLQIFPKLKKMELDFLPELERWAENSEGEINSLVFFPQLEDLTIKDCDKLATLPETPSLTDLSLKIWSPNCTRRSMRMPLGIFSSLVSLNIEGLLVDVVMPPDGQQIPRPLDTLRNLQLIGDDSCVSIFNKSKLELGLRDCLAFVEDLSINSWSSIVRWSLEEFRCLPRLRSLRISYCTKLEGMGSSSEEEEVLPLPLLESLTLNWCSRLLDIPQLPASLVELDIINCESLVALPSNLGNLANLRSLSVWGCGGLKALPDGMDGLSSLERLSIGECPGIEEFPQGLLQRLPSLKSLHIDCKSLLDIPQLPASLEELDILSCESLVALPSNLGNLANLRSLYVYSCGGLKALPDGMDGLSSLERLEISYCPGIEEFPQGLLQRLPSLKSLTIWGCPELARRCREGGEYFDLVSSIPEKDFYEWKTEEIEKPVKRFLPLCGGDSRLCCLRF